MVSAALVLVSHRCCTSSLLTYRVTSFLYIGCTGLYGGVGIPIIKHNIISPNTTPEELVFGDSFLLVSGSEYPLVPYGGEG
jgi:hypothetical protein